MALVPGICTQCGATLSADNTKDCMICPYCGTPFIVEKAINNFHNTYNISNSVVNIYGSKENDFVIRAGVLEKYNGTETSVTIPNDVIAIGKGAFKDCLGLKEVSIPQGVESIGYEAFQNCKALKSISLPNGLKEIGWYAFRWCESLGEVYLPDTITKIGYAAFDYCSNLVKVRMPNNAHGNKHTDSEDMIGAFHDCENLVNIILPNQSWLDVLGGSNYYRDLTEKQYLEKKLATENARKAQGLCRHCGGKFKGVFDVRCSSCCKRKDY